MEQILTMEEVLLLAEKSGEELGQMFIKYMNGRYSTNEDINENDLKVIADAMTKGIIRVIDGYEGV